MENAPKATTETTQESLTHPNSGPQPH
jgi:hypothetical protein